MYRHAVFAVLFVAAGGALGASPASAGKYTGPGLRAELVIRDPQLGGGRYSGDYYFDRGGYRIEIDGRARYRTFVFNSFYGYLISVGANRRMAVKEDSFGALAAQFGDAPCAGFENAISMGSKSLAGRELQVWRCERPNQELLRSGVSRDQKVTVWYDSELKHFLRKEGNDGVSIELKNVVPGRQPPALFDVPGESEAVKATSRVMKVETVGD